MSLLNTMAGLGQLGVDSDDDWNIAPDKSQSELLLLTDSGDCLIAKWFDCTHRAASHARKVHVDCSAWLK